MTVSLFHIHVVIFSSGSGSGEFNIIFFKPIFCQIVDEFTASVWMSHEPGIWQSLFNFLYALKRCLLPFVPLRSWNIQTSRGISVIKRIHSISQHGVIVKHGINLTIARRQFFPRTGKCWNDVFQMGWSGSGYPTSLASSFQEITHSSFHSSELHGS